VSTPTQPGPPSLDPSQPIIQYWNKPVSELVALAGAPIPPEAQERHRIYLYLLMSLLVAFYNGNKRGPEGDYPWRPKQRRKKGLYEGGQYLGHNIACLAVDGDGNVIDFDFNHNDLFSSSVEHAESRLVRRIFSLTQLYNDRRIRKPNDPPRDTNYLNTLSKVTIYTSLESCAQCSGIMALGKVKSIVYMQTDPGQYFVGNIMYNLTTDALRAPLPVSGDKVGLKQFAELNERYRDYYSRVANEPFYVGPNNKKDTSNAITSFLCTDSARDVFAEGKSAFDALQQGTQKLQHPDYQPTVGGETAALTNADALADAAIFLDYATTYGKRGTPHKL
jgi:tRNA(Arg) A34 adenosine deaminase TadA